MKSTITSLRVFGIYMILVPGLGLMIIPDIMLDLFNLSHGNEFWMFRMIGLLALIIGVFDYFIAKHKLAELYKLTIVLRYFATAFMTVLWLTGEAEVTILLFASVDGLGATWTYLTMQNNASTHNA